MSGPRREAEFPIEFTMDKRTPAKFGDKSIVLIPKPREMVAPIAEEIVKRVTAKVTVTGANARIKSDAHVPYIPTLFQNGLKNLSGMLVFFLIIPDITESNRENIQLQREGRADSKPSSCKLNPRTLLMYVGVNVDKVHPVQ